MPETKVVEISTRDILEILLHGAIYDETNDTELAAALRLEADKTLRTYSLQVFTDANNRERIGLIDSGRVVWSRPYEGYLQVDPVLLTNVEADLWTPGGAATDFYRVMFNIVNIDPAGPVTVTVGHAVGGGALAANEYIMQAEVIPFRGATGWMGPYTIPGLDTIRGNAAAINDASIHWDIKRVDIGA